MKANEIQIGDLVYSTFSKLPCKVTYLELYESGYASVETTNVVGVKDIASLSPIPLTPEILEKNGFTKHVYGFSFQYLKLQGNLCDDDTVYFTITISGKDITIYYVHQLQHALRLCEIEKTIEL